MRRLAAGTLVGAVLIGLSFAGTASAQRRSGVSGRVSMDAVCTMVPGARCQHQSAPATIRIERLRSGKLVRTVHARAGRFHVRLRPGRYRLRATADSGNGSGSARVHVRPHRFTAVVVRLHSAAA